MNSFRLLSASKHLLLLPCCLLLFSPISSAQQLIHFSAMVHYELMEQKWPGYDLTLIFQNRYGLRYSLMQEMDFLETISDEDGSVKKNSFEGDLHLPMVLKMLDFKTFKEGPAQVFDFVSAYVGVGYNTLELTMNQKEYYADGGNLVKTTRDETVNARVGAFSIGMYGGDSFIVIDLRLRYIRGTVDSSDYVDEENEFDKWMMIVSLGFGI